MKYDYYHDFNIDIIGDDKKFEVVKFFVDIIKSLNTKIADMQIMANSFKEMRDQWAFMDNNLMIKKGIRKLALKSYAFKKIIDCLEK